MEWKCYHRLDLRQVDNDCAIVTGSILSVKLPVRLGSAVYTEVVPDLIVGSPNGRKAGSFSGHNIYACAEVNRQGADSRANKLKHLVLDKAVFEYSTNES